MTRPARLLLPAASPFAVLGALLCALAGAQTPVDQGVADVDPLATSLRVIEQSMAEDSAFERVYADPAHPQWLVRRAGAITATFPRSSYLPTRFGSLPLIPAGTVFWIGEPDMGAQGPAGAAPRSVSVSAMPAGRSPASRVDQSAGQTLPSVVRTSSGAWGLFDLGATARGRTPIEADRAERLWAIRERWGS